MTDRMYRLTTLKEVQESLNPDELVAVDAETHNYDTGGFYGNIELVQFFQRDWPEVLLVRRPDIYHLAAVLQKQPFFGHNIHYDISTIQDQSDTTFVPDQFEDTLYASRLHFFHKENFSLDSVLEYVLGYEPYKAAGLDKKVLQKSNWSQLLTEDQLMYAALDVYHMFAVWDRVQEQTNAFSYKLDMLFTRECLAFQRNGMPVDSLRLQQQFQKNDNDIKEMDMPINVNSWQQVRPYIGEDESDALALATFAIRGNERAGNVNKTRKLIKQNSFLRKFDEDLGRIYGKFIPSARSGRCTSKDQNLQQLPRKTKGVFGVTEDSGRILTYSDYSQLELRGACAITNEAKMETLFRSGEDLHGYTAHMLFGENYTKEQRQIAKTCNFNLLYGGGHNMLGSILIKDASILLPEFELKDIKRKWQKLWPTLVSWQQTGISAWRNKQPWQTPLGRKYVGKMMTDQLNIQVQGFGAEVAKLATHYMMPRVREIDSDIKLCDFIHDSWIFENDDDESLCLELSTIVAESMQEAWVEASRSVKIKDLPMPVDVFSGPNWGDIEAGKFKYEYKAQ